MSSRVLVLFLLLLWIPTVTNAAESSNEFDIELLPAEGQQIFSEGYFNIAANPGQSIPLYIRITNNTDHPIELLIETADSWTAEEGGILYGTHPLPDAENHIHLTDLISVQETILIPANEVEDIHYHVDAPMDASGTILGGVMLTAVDDNYSTSTEVMNTGGSNYIYEKQGQRLVAVKLNFPDHSASSFSVDKVVFDNNLLSVKVANSNAAVIENVHGTYTILDTDGETLVAGDIKAFAMSPKSEIRYPIDLKNHVFEDGKYVLMIKGSADKKEFFAEEMFTISENSSAATASETFEAASSVSVRDYTPALAIALAALFLVLPLLLKILRKNENNQYINLTDKNNL